MMQIQKALKSNDASQLRDKPKNTLSKCIHNYGLNKLQRKRKASKIRQKYK